MSSPDTATNRKAGMQRGTATTPTEADGGTVSVWDGCENTQAQTSTQGMDIDDEDCASQKSSSSLTGFPPLGKEKREKNNSRGRGIKAKEPQRMPPKRVQPP